MFLSIGNGPSHWVLRYPHTLSYFHCMAHILSYIIIMPQKRFVLRILHGELKITGFMVWVVRRYRLRLSSFKLIKCFYVMFNGSLKWRNKWLNLRP